MVLVDVLAVLITLPNIARRLRLTSMQAAFASIDLVFLLFDDPKNQISLIAISCMPFFK